MDNKQKILHKVKIVDGQILLDDFALKGVTAFEIKETARGLAKVKIELNFKSSNLNVR